MSCRETGLLPARYIVLPEEVEAVEADGRCPVDVFPVGGAREGGGGSQGGNVPSADR